jgi:hypothetical protein
VRFHRIKYDPADAFGCLGTVTGDVGKRGRWALAPLHTTGPTGPTHTFWVPRPGEGRQRGPAGDSGTKSGVCARFHGAHRSLGTQGSVGADRVRWGGPHRLLESPSSALRASSGPGSLKTDLLKFDRGNLASRIAE